MTERIEFAGYSGEFQRDPLPDAMDAAADTLVSATLRYKPKAGLDPKYEDWRPVNLRSVAAQWRAVDEDRVEVLMDLTVALENMRVPLPTRVAAALVGQFDITPKSDRVEGGPAAMMGVGPWERDAPEKPVVDPYYSEAFSPMRGGA